MKQTEFERSAKRIAALFLSLMLVMLTLQPLTAHAEESGQQVIRVAFPTQEGMSFNRAFR